MQRIYIVMSDDNGEDGPPVCATRDEAIATEIAARCGGRVEGVILIDPEGE